jgi:hypothetical protein
MRVYQHSGIVPVRSAFATFVVGSLAAAALGVTYSFTFQYIPYVHLNFLFAIGFGVATGLAVAWGARRGKIRHTAVTGALALLAVLAGIYVEWGTTVYALCPAADLPQLWTTAGLKPLLPHHVLGVMIELFDHGSWSLDGGAAVRGWPLVSLWFAEAAVIMTAAYCTATSQVAKRAFCEKCQEWIASRRPHLYVGDGNENVWSEIQLGSFDNLAQTPHASGGEDTFVKLTLNVCEGCSDSNFLTITNCRRRRNSKGQEWVEEKDAVTNGIVTATQAEIIEAANTIAPGIGETPVELGTSASIGNWTLQPTTPLPEIPTPVQS